MKRATLFQIAREGWFVLIPLCAIVIAVHALWDWWAALPVVALAVLAAVFFRDRNCRIAAGPLAIIAPVDGVVTHRREGYDPFLDRQAIKVSIRVDRLGDYYLRSPVEGRLLELHDDGPGTPGGLVSWLRTDEDDDIVYAITKGVMFGLRPCLGNFGIRVGQGRCCGVRRLARSIDVYLPHYARVLCEPGDSVHAGSTVLANLVKKAG